MAGLARIVAVAIALVVLWADVALAQGVYALDPRFARIEFSVSHLGLFTTKGIFRAFESRLVIDAHRPERTEITIEIDTASVEVPTEEAARMLRSAAYFDSAEHRQARFHSTGVNVQDPTHFRIDGVLEIRGIDRPVALDAVLTERKPDPTGPGDIADFVVSGVVSRSAFGMTADRDFISDPVSLSIRARIRLDRADGG